MTEREGELVLRLYLFFCLFFASPGIRDDFSWPLSCDTFSNACRLQCLSSHANNLTPGYCSQAPGTGSPGAGCAVTWFEKSLAWHDHWHLRPTQHEDKQAVCHPSLHVPSPRTNRPSTGLTGLDGSATTPFKPSPRVLAPNEQIDRGTSQCRCTAKKISRVAWATSRRHASSAQLRCLACSLLASFSPLTTPSPRFLLPGMEHTRPLLRFCISAPGGVDPPMLAALSVAAPNRCPATGDPTYPRFPRPLSVE